MAKTIKAKKKNRHILLYAASEIDANILYATDFIAPDPFIFFRTAQGKKYLVMSDLEIDRAKTTSNVHHVLSLSRYTRLAEQRKKGKAPNIAEIIVEVFREKNIRSVTVPENFPLRLADDLRKHKIRVTAQPGSMFPERLYKSTAEVKEIRKAMQACEAGMRTAEDTLRQSKIKNGYVIFEGQRLTAEILRKRINSVVFSLGYLPSRTIVSPGKHGCDPHDEGSGPIRANSPVIIDIFPRSDSSGYFGDMTRTFLKGKAPDKIARMYRSVKAAQLLGLRMIKAGAACKTIHQSIVDLFEKNGFPSGEINGRMQGFFHGTGHGLGLEIHEPPRIAINDLILEKGMVVTVEPGLYYHPIGGVRIEDTVLVTQTGIRNLTRFAKRLEIP